MAKTKAVLETDSWPDMWGICEIIPTESAGDLYFAVGSEGDDMHRTIHLAYVTKVDERKALADDVELQTGKEAWAIFAYSAATEALKASA